MPFDAIDALNHLSEVINNRPKAIREFDQIYMRAGDMLLQTEHVSKFFHNKEVVFIGDGDSVALSLVYLHHNRVIDRGPRRVHVLDFDERIVNAIRAFAKRFDLEDRISSECYNVAHPIPKSCWQSYDAFYTNPPFGQSNGGRSIEAFMARGLEALRPSAIASVVIADDPELSWTQEILLSTQQYMAARGFLVAESLPAFHTYHLEDNPKLRSCSITFRRMAGTTSAYASQVLSPDFLNNFYGEGLPLRVARIQDNLAADKMPSRDYTIISL